MQVRKGTQVKYVVCSFVRWNSYMWIAGVGSLGIVFVEVGGHCDLVATRKRDVRYLCHVDLWT